MICQKCGKENKDGAKFCDECGFALQGSPVVQPNTAIPSPTPLQIKQDKRKKKFILIGIIAFFVIGIIGCIASESQYKQDMDEVKNYISDSKYDEAIKILDNQKSSNNSKEDIYINYAECYVGKKQYQKALDVLKEGKNKASDSKKIDDKIVEINSTYGAELKAEKDAKAKAEAEKKKKEDDAKKKAEAKKKQQEEAERKKEKEEQEKQEAQAKKKNQDIINSAQTVDYKELARYPDKYKGKAIKVTVEISQVMESGFLTDGGFRAYEDYDIDITNENSTFLQKEWFIDLDPSDCDPKILDKDVITFYGTYEGTEEITRALTGTGDSIPKIKPVQYEILK